MLSNEPDPDVLVIGAGPTGAVAAKRFVSAGMRVVVLEQGDWPDYSKARANHPDFELTAGVIGPEIRIAARLRRIIRLRIPVGYFRGALQRGRRRHRDLRRALAAQHAIRFSRPHSRRDSG